MPNKTHEIKQSEFEKERTNLLNLLAEARFIQTSQKHRKTSMNIAKIMNELHRSWSDHVQGLLRVESNMQVDKKNTNPKRTILKKTENETERSLMNLIH